MNLTVGWIPPRVLAELLDCSEQKSLKEGAGQKPAESRSKGIFKKYLWHHGTEEAENWISGPIKGEALVRTSESHLRTLRELYPRNSRESVN